MVHIAVCFRETGVASKKVDRVRFEQSVVQLVEDGPLHFKDLRSCVGVGCDVLEVVDTRSVDFFVFGGDEERCYSNKLEVDLGDYGYLGGGGGGGGGGEG